MAEIIELTGNASPTEALRVVEQAVMDDEKTKVKDMMDIFDPDERLSIVKKSGHLVLLAIEYNSSDCLNFFLTLRQSFKEQYPELFDKIDGLVEPDRGNKNALHFLARQKSGSERVKLLEDHVEALQGIIDKPDDTGLTPLLMAVKRNNEEIARYLVKNGANFKNIIKDQSPINIAIENGQTHVLEEMLQAPLCEHESMSEMFQNSKLFGKGHTILYPAAASGKDDIFNLLLEKMGEEDAKSNLIKEMNHKTESEKFLRYISSSGMTEAMEKLMSVDEQFAVGLKAKTGKSLMWAVEGLQMKMIDLILKSNRGMETIYLDDDKGRNVFHYAAEAKQSEVLKRLMQQDEYSVLYSKKDNDGCSPLHHAAREGSTENVDLLLKYANMNKESIFHCTVCVKKSSDKILERILLHFKENDKESFNRVLQSKNKEKRTPLHEAAYAGRKDIVKLLLDNGASIDARSAYFNWSALHYAVAGKSLPTVKYLVGKNREMVNWRSDDDETATVLAAESGCAEILRHLLQNGGKAFGEYRKENLLDCVTRFTHMPNRNKAALEIIEFCVKDGEVDDLKKLMKNSEGGTGEIMSKLLKQMPDVAVKILNKCLKNIDSTDLENTHKYNFFPIQDDTKKDLKAIKSMIKYKRYDCLAHPLVVQFLDEKWNCSNARIWYFLNILLYTTFLLSMTTYIGLQAKGSYKLTSPGLIGLSMVSIAVILCNVIKEIVQIIFSWKDYFFDPNNYLEWTMYVSATFYLIPLTNDKTEAQTEAGAIAVLLAWINFVWFFKRLSLFGIYIIMAKKVFTSLLKVLPMVFLFIFAFSMAFYVLMTKDEGFRNISLSMLTTSVMMIGEIDYRGVFLGKGEGPHYLLERLFLFCFLVIMTIVIMNLLVGLAVGDTDEIMKRSKAEKRYYKASLIVTLQSSLLHLPVIKLRDVPDPLEVDEKNKKKKKSWLVKLFDKVYTDNDVDDVDETQMILSRLGKMEESMENMKTMLANLSKNMNIVENEDTQQVPTQSQDQ